jgi:MoxR-like ATPase
MTIAATNHLLKAPAADAPPASVVAEQLDKIAAALNAAEKRINQVILGQEAAVEMLILTIMAGGHALLVGSAGRGQNQHGAQSGHRLWPAIQTGAIYPDLMPSDILGSEVLDQAADGRRSFRFLQAVFCQLLLADEVNRASPRTQSALLQAMQEGW